MKITKTKNWLDQDISRAKSKFQIDTQNSYVFKKYQFFTEIFHDSRGTWSKGADRTSLKLHLARAHREMHPRKRHWHLVAKTQCTLVSHVIYLITLLKLGLLTLWLPQGWVYSHPQDCRLIILKNCIEKFQFLFFMFYYKRNFIHIWLKRKNSTQ